jgi:hypothetical protein
LTRAFPRAGNRAGEYCIKGKDAYKFHFPPTNHYLELNFNEKKTSLRRGLFFGAHLYGPQQRGSGASLPGIDAFSDITPFALDLKEKSFIPIVFINY